MFQSVCIEFRSSGFGWFSTAVKPLLEETGTTPLWGKKKNPVSLDSHSKAAIYFIYFLQAAYQLQTSHIAELFVCLFLCVCVKVVCCLLQNTVIFIHHMVFMDFIQKIPTTKITSHVIY